MNPAERTDRALDALRASTAQDWLLVAPPERTGDPAYPWRVTVRNTNTRIGGYMHRHTYRCPDIASQRYFRTSETIAHALCVLANDDTRRYYGALIDEARAAGNVLDANAWERRLLHWEENV